MHYTATFGIDYGVSYGLDIKFPDYLEIEKSLTAKDDFNALLISTKKAIYFSLNYSNNPKTNFTIVTLIELHNEYQDLINQKETLKRRGYAHFENFRWDEQNRLFTKHSKFKHSGLTKLMKISNDSFLMN